MSLEFVTKTLGKVFGSEKFLHAFQVWLFEDLTPSSFFCFLFILAGIWWFRIQMVNQIEEKRHRREMEKIKVLRENE